MTLTEIGQTRFPSNPATDTISLLKSIVTPGEVPLKPRRRAQRRGSCRQAAGQVVRNPGRMAAAAGRCQIRRPGGHHRRHSHPRAHSGRAARKNAGHLAGVFRSDRSAAFSAATPRKGAPRSVECRRQPGSKGSHPQGTRTAPASGHRRSSKEARARRATRSSVSFGTV